jgi:hypothetical protein
MFNPASVAVFKFCNPTPGNAATKLMLKYEVPICTSTLFLQMPNHTVFTYLVE